MFLQRMPRSKFAINAATLMAGTTIAQGISVALSPVMTRLFRPQDYGVLALFMSMVGMVSITATGRYSHAIIIAKNDEDAANVLTLCFSIVSFVSLSSLLVLLCFNDQIAHALGNDGISHWLLLAPIAVFLAGTYEILSSWANRRGKFKRLAGNRIGLTGATSAIQIVIGLLRFGAGGLICGYINAQSMAVALLGWQSWKEDRKLLIPVSFDRVKKVATQFRKFPLYSLPTETLNVATNQLPILLFTAFVGPVAVGLYSLTQRVLSMPMGIVAGSVTEVFKQRASTDYVKNGNCRDIYVKTFKSLSLLSIVPFIVLFVFAPMVFGFVFGQRWKEAGEYVRVMSPMYFLGFTSSPLSYVYFIAGKQKEDLLIHIYMAASSIGSISLGYYVFKTPLYVMMCFSINYSLIYVLYLVRSYALSKGDASSLRNKPAQGPSGKFMEHESAPLTLPATEQL